jgi:hypothetical protein
VQQSVAWKRSISASALLAALVCLLFVSSVRPAQAAGILVESAVDVVAADGICTLREAIANANADADTTDGDCDAGSGADTITFAADYTVTLAGSQLPAVVSVMTIAGNGPANTIVQAAATPNMAGHRVFEVGAVGDLTLEQMTVRHGFCGGGFCSTGGAIHNAGTLNVNGSTLSANVASDRGGCIYSQGVLNLTGSACSGNTAGEGGGGIHNDGGAANLTDSTISGNVAFSEGAGLLNNAGTLTVTGSTISENVLSIDGGGIFNRFEATLTVTNSTLSDNSAAFRGGGLLSDGTATVTNTTVTGNAAEFEGGGIHGGASGSLTLSRNLVSGNLAFGSSQGDGEGSEIYNPNGTIIADDFNLLGHGALTDAEAFLDFTPGASDRTATSDGTHPTALAAILGVLGDNGGATFTHALIAGSPAIDFGPSADCAAATVVGGLDQRGEMRGVDLPGTGNEGGPNLCDSGAYEAQAPAAVPISAWADLLIVLLLVTFGSSRCYLRGSLTKAT